MKIKYILVILFASMSFYSCEDFFDSVTDVDIEDHESRLAVFCYLTEDSNFHLARVGNSKGYSTGESPDQITDATLTLSKGGITLGEFDHQGTDAYSLSVDLDESVGDEIRLDISAPGYESIFAVTTVTPEINVSQIEYKGKVFSQEYGEPIPEYEVRIVDDGAVDNFYAVEVLRLDTINQNAYGGYITSNDPSISEWWNVGLVFDDKTFNGNTFNAQILVDAYDGLYENEVYVFTIKSISEEMYQYAKSYTNYQYSFDNPFAEPVTVTSNMQEDAFGIFSYIRNQRFIVTE